MRAPRRRSFDWPRNSAAASRSSSKAAGPVRALAFYVRRGYRLVRLHLDGMDRVRAAKPQVPDAGNEGIALRDMWELEKELG